jgi:bifunctional non-homologous end joining protein LigD
VAAKKQPAGVPGKIEITITHADRPVYPDDGITKQDIADYFEAVSGAMLKTLVGRPLGLQHWQKGIRAPGFFHQNIGKEAQPWMTLAETPVARKKKGAAQSIRHLVADRPETLRWMAQYSALTVHMWHSKLPDLDEPSWVLFDLDPGEGHGIEQALAVAHPLKEILDQQGLESIPKTSGKRGIHVFVPLDPGHTFEQTQAFALKVGDDLSYAMPEEVTLERAIAKREGRLYFDVMQNAKAKMVVAPYSLRALPGAPVSAPLEWDEVKEGLNPLDYNLRNMPARLKSKGDLFAAATQGGGRLR